MAKSLTSRSEASKEHDALERKSLKLYRKVLRQIEKELGIGSTDDTQLEETGTEIFGPAFKGVFPSNKVPRLTQKQPYLIANTDRANQPGTHWLALARYLKNPNMVFLYDSFGRPTDELVPWISKQKVVDAELDAEQKEVESNCGQRCLAWLVVFDEMGPDAALTI